MARKTYAQIRDEQKLFGKGELSSDEYSQLMNRITKSQDYAAGLGGGLGKTLKGGSYAIDQALRGLGITKAAGDIGEGIFGSAGRAPFEAVPRMIADTIPFAVGGPVGLGLGAGAMGTNTYEKTNSPGAAVVSGGLGVLAPFAGKAVGAGAVGLAGKLGVNTAATEAIAAGTSEGLPAILRGQLAQQAVKAGTATSLVAGGALKSPLARLANYAGEQAGFYGANLATQALTNATAADKGQGWGAAKQTFEPANLLASAIGQTPFMLHPVLPAVAPNWGQAWKTNAEVKFVKDYSTTLARYDAEQLAPRRDQILQNRSLDQLRTAVDQRVQQQAKLPLGLPAPSSPLELAQRKVESEQRLSALPGTQPIELGFNDSLLSNEAKNIPPDVQAKLIPQGNQGTLWTKLPLLSRSQALTSTDPQIQVASSMLATKTSPEAARQNIVEATKRGIPAEDALQEQIARMKAEAQSNFEKEAQKEQETAVIRQKKAERKALNDTQRNQFFEEWSKTASPEEKAAFASAQKKLGPSAQSDANMRLVGTLKSWHESGDKGNLEALNKRLASAAGNQNRRDVLHNTRENVETFATPLDAKLAVVEKRIEQPEFHWSNDGPVMFKKQWAEQRASANEDYAPDAAAISRHEESLREAVQRPEEKTATRSVRLATDSTADSYAASLDADTLENLGGIMANPDEAVQKGQERLSTLLGLLENNVDKKTWKATLLGHDELWANEKELTEWLKEARPQVDEYKQRLAGLVEGRGKAIGESVDSPLKPTYVGQRETLGSLLRAVGLEDHLDEVSRLAALFDNSDVAYAQLTGRKDGTEENLPLGLFTQQTDGQKLVWLAAANDPQQRKLFALAHELNGHALWEWAHQGKLDAVSIKQLNDYRNMVAENAPEVNQKILREVWDTLPEKYKEDTGLRRLVETTVSDPDEVLANLNAMVSLAMVNSKPSKWSTFLSTMPKPIADFVALVARYGRKVYESISGLMFAKKQGWTDGAFNKEQSDALHGYLDTMYKVLKFDQQRANDVRQGMKVDLATDTPLRYATAQSSGQMFNESASNAGSVITQEFGLRRKKDGEEEMAKPASSLSARIDKNFFRLESLAVKYPQLRHTLTQATRRDAATNRLEADILKPLGLEASGVGMKAHEDNAIFKVASDPRLADIRDSLNAKTQEEQKTLQQLIDEGHPEVKDILQKLTPAEQQTMRESFLRSGESHAKSVEGIRQSEYEKLVFQLGRVLMEKDFSKSLNPDTAEAQSRQLVQSVMNGTPDVASPLAEYLPFVQELAQRIDQKVGAFASRPEYISTRRYGDFAARIEYKDESRAREALDFQTKESREAFERKHKAEIDAGEMRVSDLKREKTPFNVINEGLDFLLREDRKSQQKLIDLLVFNGLSSDKAQEIAASTSDAEHLTRELAARSLPNMSPHRKLIKGYENLDMLQQQVEYTQILTRALTKGVANAEFEMRMLDPELDKVPPEVGQQLRDAWDNYKRPDSQAVRAINNLNYFRYLALNFLNMAQDATQALTGALPAAMINDGAGVGQSMRRILGSMRDLRFENRLSADEKAALENFRKGNRGLASYNDNENNDYLNLVNNRLITKGEKALTLKEMVMRPFHGFMLWAKNLHKPFTNFGMESAMLASFRHFKSKGMSATDAERSAFDLATLSMGATGKGGRQAGLWKMSAPVAAVMTALQSYAFNQLGTWKNTFERAIGQVPNMSPAERTQAWKALGTHTSIMFAQAGILGLPLAGTMLALVDKLFDINSKEAVAGFLHDVLPDDENHILQQLAMHGAVNSFGGVDYASKAQVPGVLGLNPNDGFSPEALVGPTWNVVKDLTGAGKSLVHGDVEQALEQAAPNTLKRGLQAHRDDWEFRRKDGSMIDESTPFEQSAWAVLGLKPQRVASLQERDQWQRVDAQIDQKERGEWLDEVARQFEGGDAEGAKQAIVQRTQDRPGEHPAAVANAMVERVLDRTSPRDTSRSPGASGRLNQVTGLPANSLGESQRLELTQVLLQKLGMGLPAQRSQHVLAQQVDQLRTQQPWLSYKEAVQQVQQGTSQGVHAAFRGLNWGQH